MDLEAIKKKLEALNQDSQRKPQQDYAKYFWKPKDGRNKIRIVPSMYDPDNPFTELTFYGSISKYPMLALSNLGQQDPVLEFAENLRNLGGKDNWSLAGKISPRPRYFVPVIVRGEEEQGVRLWNIGVTIYKALMQLAADEEVGDYTDISNGIDIIVTRTPGDPYPDTTIMASRGNSPLSEDKSLVKKWLSEQPKPVDCFRHYDYNQVKKILEQYLTGGASSPAPVQAQSESAADEGEAKTKPAEKKPSAAAAKKAEAPKSVTSKFDDLFADDDKSGDEEDELPF